MRLLNEYAEGRHWVRYLVVDGAPTQVVFGVPLLLHQAQLRDGYLFLEFGPCDTSTLPHHLHEVRCAERQDFCPYQGR